MVNWGAASAQDEIPTELKRVRGVVLEGRRHVSAKEIWSVLKTKRPGSFPWSERPVVRRDFLISDALTIEVVYRQHGYLDVLVDFKLEPTRDPALMKVIFTITEGPRSFISSVDLVGFKTLSPDALRKKLWAKVDRAFNPTYLIADTARISSEYKEHGYLPHVVGSFRRDSTRVAVRYDVDEGPQYLMGETYLSSPGELHVREKLIRRELVLKPGDVYRASRVQHSVERLYQTGLFSQVSIAPLPDSTNTRVEFDLRVRERKPRWVDAGVGSGTAERFNFTGEWGHRNLAGQELQGVLTSRLAFNGNADFLLSHTEASLLEPWLLGTRTRGLVTAYYEARNDRANPNWVIKQEAPGFSLQLRRDFGRFSHVALIEDNTYLRQSIQVLADTIPQAVVDTVTPRYTTRRLSLDGVRDTRDDPLNATRGTVQFVTAEVAGGPLRGTSSFTKGQFAYLWYTPFNRGWVLATRARVGAIDPYGEARTFSPAGLDPLLARVPLEDRFRIGGANSVRGYNESEITATGGLAEIQANVELRVPVVGPFGLELFMDVGNVWARWSYIKWENFLPELSSEPLDPSDLRYAFGLGARLMLPFGPLRLDFAWTPRPDPGGQSVRRGRAQFAIGNSF
jgi:outer membrane protein insertion porin family